MSRSEQPSPSHWREVQRLFHRALERPEAERVAWLAATDVDAAMRAEVEAMLTADADPATPLDHARGELFSSPAASPAAPGAPDAPAAPIGPYRVVRTIGRGGMGIVHLATDERTGATVALKVLRPAVTDALTAVESRRRFLREIRVGLRLSHPGLVPVLDSGESDGRLWFTMPFVDGESLRDRMKREPRLPLGLAAAIGRQLADALAWLASLDVVHRDVKPDNVLLGREADGSVRARLADFGVARALDAADVDGRLTAAGMLLGTVRYMSPEQVRGEHVDGATDVFALAGVVHEMLTGEPPFRLSEQRALVRRAPGSAPVPLPDVRRTRPEVPEAVADVLRQALAPEARDRPSASTLAQRLATVADAAERR